MSGPAFTDSLPRSILVAVCALLALACAGCGGSDDPTDPDPGGGGGGGSTDDPLYTETTTLIDAASTSLSTHLTTLDLPDAMTAVAAELAADTCVAAAACYDDGTGDPYLLAEFTNGILYVMPVIRVDTLRTERPTPDLARKADLAEMHIVGSQRAVFIELPQFSSAMAIFADIAGDVGYTVDPITVPTVASFTNLNQYGLVYIGTHGLFFEHDGEHYFGMLTAETRGADQDVAFLAADEFRDVGVMLERGVWIVEEEDPYVSEDTRYAITDRYIMRHNGPFPEHAIFYADACQSAKADNVLDGPPLSAAVATLGVQNYLGWNQSVHVDSSLRATNFLFAHLLGKITTAMTPVLPDGPPIRPSTLTDTWTALVARGWDVDNLTNLHAELELHDFSEGHDEALLRPSISQLYVDIDPGERTQELRILGDFGSDAGHVYICSDPDDTASGGIELSDLDWDKDTIVATMQEGHHGYVVVEAGGRRSNAHPLSQWEMGIDVSGTYDPSRGPSFELTMNAIWRAEFVAERPSTDQEPADVLGWANTMFGLDATADFAFTGTFEDSRYIYEYRDEAPNVGSMDMGWDGTNFYFGTVVLKPSESNAVIQASLSREVTAYVTDKQNPELPPVARQYTVAVMGYIDTSMFPVSGMIAEGESTVPYNTSWQDATPVSPPVESTGR